MRVSTENPEFKNLAIPSKKYNYVEGIYDPDIDRHDYLVEKVKSSGAQGVVFWYIKFCEPDAFDRPQLVSRLKQEGIPATTIEIELSMTNFDPVKTRINAFYEMLEE